MEAVVQVLVFNGKKNVGTYCAPFTFKENYTGTIKKELKIISKGTSISNESKVLTVKWKKQAARTTGYQITYAIQGQNENRVELFNLICYNVYVW